jgi:DNA-binding XRE family transcriptional regulator
MLNDKLIELRAKSRRSRKIVADCVDIAQSTYRSYETGRSKPNSDTIKKLCWLFNISPNELLEWDK